MFDRIPFVCDFNQSDNIVVQCIEAVPDAAAPVLGEDGQPIEGAAPVQIGEDGKPITTEAAAAEPEPEVVKILN